MPVEKDDQVRLLLEAATPVVTIVGKTWLLHVQEVLRTTPQENLGMIADTIRVYEDGFGVEVLMTSRPGVSGIQRQEQELQLTYGEGYVTFDVDYACKDQLATFAASCIAGPHHRGVRSSNGMMFTYSVMYRVPLVFERVGPILTE